MIVARGFGLSPIAGAIVAMGLGIERNQSAVSHSGTTRLWMYELYAKSIEEDHKKRGLIKEEPVAIPQVQLAVSKKAKTKPARRAARRVEQSAPYPNLPRYAPVFKMEAENAAILNEIDNILDEVNKSPFKRLKPIQPKEIKVEKNEIEPLIVAYEEFVKAKVEKEKKIKKRRKNNEAMLLLLAA
jgi:hypothetical protein